MFHFLCPVATNHTITSMDSLIKQLVQTNSRVNIPAFGAFIVDREGDNVNVLFNQHLNYNDGLLSGELANARGISIDEAMEQISAYVNSLNSKLNEGQTAEIEGVGEFKKNDLRVEFTLAKDFTLDAPEPEKKSTIDIEPAAILTKTESTETAAESAEEHHDEAANTVIINNNQTQSKRTAMWIVLIVVLFLVALFLCLFVINKDNAVYNFFFPTEEVAEVPAVVEEVVEIEPEPEPVVEAAPAEKRYNIVVGTYNSTELAQKRVDALKAKGFETAEVATFRGKPVAIIESHATLVEAERRQEYIVDTYRIESYITNGGE